MSVYITVQNADLKKKPTKDLFVIIQSQGAVLKTLDVEPSQHPSWEASSIVGSIKQRSLFFQVRENGEIKDSIVGSGKLRFNSFEFTPSKDIPIQLKLKNSMKKEVGTLHLNVFFNQSKNYVGEIEFYEIGKAQTASNIRYIYELDQISGGNGIKIPKERVKFYKGPCHTKNAFSCLDAGTQGQKFEVVENHYRDDYF